jgi:hypothetical protein
VHREAERSLQDVLLLHPHSEGEKQARHQARKLTRQLYPAPVDEDVDDGQIERLPPSRRQRLRAGAGEVDAVTLAPEHHGQGATARHVPVDEENGCHPGLGKASDVPRTGIDDQGLTVAKRPPGPGRLTGIRTSPRRFRPQGLDW